MQNLAPIVPWNLPVSITLLIPSRDIVLENLVSLSSLAFEGLRDLTQSLLDPSTKRYREGFERASKEEGLLIVHLCK